MNGNTSTPVETDEVEITDGQETTEANIDEALPPSGEVTPEEQAELDNLLGKISNNESGETSSDGIVPPGAEVNASPDLNEKTNEPQSSANFPNTVVAEVEDEVSAQSVLS
jgi:hypothetical protein